MTGMTPCSICLDDLEAPGRARFIAECGHSFHFTCIEANAQRGNCTCPLCRAQWQTLPFVVSASASQPLAARRSLSTETVLPYCDDEDIPVLDDTDSQPRSSSTILKLNISRDRKAVLASEFATVTALITVKAPSDAENPSTTTPASAGTRLPLDLVAVIDVSGSMHGEKLSLLRKTLISAVDLLGPRDRLSIVKFEDSASRMTPLTCMGPSGKTRSQEAIMRLCADGGTSIASALETAASIVEQRRQRNPVCGILLLTDGQDESAYAAYRPFVRRARDAGASISTFGYGQDHDAKLLEVISEAGGGDFTYIENLDTVRESFGRCLGSMFSVVAQSARLRLEPRGGSTLTRVMADGVQTRLADGGVEVEVGELFRDETRDLLVEIALPVTGEASEGVSYLEASVSWLVPGAAEGHRQQSASSVLSMDRTLEAPAAVAEDGDSEEVMAVDRQRNRVMTVEAITKAVECGDANDFNTAQSVLREASRMVSESSSAAEPFVKALIADLQDATLRTGSSRDYSCGGSARLRSSKMSHKKQRTFSSDAASSSMYHTPSQVRTCTSIAAGLSQVKFSSGQS